MANPQRDRQFKVLKFVGKGSYGSVFLVQRLADGQTYALKEMDVRSMSQAEREDSINEIRLLASVSHPNVISYNEAFLDGNRLCIIMEYAADGDLAKVIKKQQMLKRPLPEDTIWRYFLQVVLGLQALHGMKILHRDIKPGNIMVFQSGVVKIGDLGIAKLLTKTAAAKTQIGTPHYMGPEIWKNRPYSYTSDTWAIGCLLYELAALAVPFEARSMSELRYKVLRGTYPPLPAAYSRDLQQLVRECLDPNPDRRPTMDALLASPAVQSRLKMLPNEVRNPPPTAGSALVETIKVPRGNIAAIKHKLPPAQYATDMLNMGGGGQPQPGNGQMATIEEGSEDDQPPPRPARQRAPSRQPALQPLPLQAALPKPRYPPAPASEPAARPPLPPLPPLPAVASAPPSEAGGGLGGPYANRLPPVRPPLQAAPPPPSQGGASAWVYAGPGGQQQPGGKVSESHANYGAFYHNAYTPGNAAGPGGAAQVPSAWQAGNKWPQQPLAPLPQQQYQQQQLQQVPLQPQQYQQYQSPYISPYGGQQRNYGGPGPGPGANGGVPHLPQLQLQKHGNGVAVVKSPPPWNYGAQAGQRRNGRGPGGQLAPVRPVGAGHYPGGDGQPPEVPRYPPPQWAPRPARW